MRLIERVQSDMAYLAGAMRVLRRTTPIGKHPDRSLRELFEEKVAQFADRPALIGDAETLTYSDLDKRANRYARWAMSKGIGKGDVVALLAPNSPDYLAIWLGVAKAGGVTALVNINLRGDSLAHSVAVVDAKFAIVDQTLIQAFASTRDARAAGKLAGDFPIYVIGAGEGPRFDVEAKAFSDAPLTGDERRALTVNDRCILIYTSGTTGLPKAANMNHYRVQLAMLGFSGVTDGRAEDRIYDCLPMYHSVGGVLGPGVALMNGGACVIKEKFSAREFWPDVVRHGCTGFCYIGELCRYLVNTPPSPQETQHKLRFCFGNGMRPDVWPEFKRRFRIPDIREYYAATEGNCNIFNFDSRAGAVGRIPWFLERKFPIKVVKLDMESEKPLRGPDGLCVECAPDEPGEMIGEIVNDPSKPGSRFEGYADKAETEKKILRDVFARGDAWFRSGDILRKDAYGYFYFVDRIGDTFRWKGENVSTNEVSERLTGFPGLLESTVYGVSIPGFDGRAGMISLVIEDFDAFDLEAFHAHVKAQLPDYARPLFLRFRRHLETTGTFKQRKVDLLADGFDPSRIFDPLYFDMPRENRYAPLDEALYERIVSGQLRL